MKQDGGNIKCEKCGEVTGYIYEHNHKYIKYRFYCKCGKYGNVEIIRGKRTPLKYPQRRLYQKGSEHICPNCERMLFRVEEETVLNYAFNVICRCGVEYDMKYIIKRPD